MGLAGAVAAAWATGDGKGQALVLLGSTALVDVTVLLLAARAMRIREVTEVVGLVTSRLRR